jgi:integrase
MPKLATTRLTKTIIDRGSPGDHLQDSEVRGLALRVHANGRRSFTVRYVTPDGRHRRISIGAYGDRLTLDQARKRARELLAEVARGGDPSGERQASRAASTLALAADRYIEEHARIHCKPRTVQAYALLLRVHILPALGSRKLADITRADIERMHREIGAKPTGKNGEGAKGAANRALQLTKAVINRAIDIGDLDARNPAARVKMHRGRKMERFLSPDERARLWRALEDAERRPRGAPGYLAPGSIAALRLLALTGARKGEIEGLTWSMVDWTHGCLRLPDSKTGAKVIRLAAATLDLLRGLHRERALHVPWVCPSLQGGRLNNLERAWRTLRDATGLHDVRIHDLRHSAASDAIMAGVPLALVGAMLGHKNEQTTRRYAHISDEVLQAAVERTGEAIIEHSQGATTPVLPLRRQRG